MTRAMLKLYLNHREQKKNQPDTTMSRTTNKNKGAKEKNRFKIPEFALRAEEHNTIVMNVESARIQIDSESLCYDIMGGAGQGELTCPIFTLLVYR